LITLSPERQVGEVGILLILYAAGIVTLVADIFLPSHAILTALGIGLLGFAIYRTFQISEAAGWVGLTSCVVLLPLSAYLGIKNWYRTPFGRRLAPPNPKLTADHIGSEVRRARGFIGQTGRTVSSLRPVGICEFSGHRFSCIAESGMIDASVDVVGIGVAGTNLMVRERESAPGTRAKPATA
jgi:membrane-bound ClpP family serine protease